MREDAPLFRVERNRAQNSQIRTEMLVQSITARAKRTSPAPSVDTLAMRTRTRRGTSSPVLYRAGLALRGGSVRRVAAMPRPQLPMNREPLLWPSGVSRNPPPSDGGGCQ